MTSIEKYFIPTVDDIGADEYERLTKAILPVVERDGALWYIEQPDLVRVAFTWSPAFTEEAKGLEAVGKIRTLHKYSFYGFFKPSISEVILQIPRGTYGYGVDAFCVRGPEDVDDLNRNKEELDAGFHVAETTLYRGFEPWRDGA